MKYYLFNYPFNTAPLTTYFNQLLNNTEWDKNDE